MIGRCFGYRLLGLARDVLTALEDLELYLWRDASQAIVLY